MVYFITGIFTDLL